MANRSQAGLTDIERAAIQILVERELTAAVGELRSKSMSVYELKQALSDIPGIEDLTVRYANNGNQIVSHAGQAAEVSLAASNEEIRDALQNPFKSTGTLKAKSMPTIGEQLKAAMAQLREARQAAADAVTESADASRVVLQEVEKARKEAADLRAEVAELTNGGPA